MKHAPVRDDYVRLECRVRKNLKEQVRRRSFDRNISMATYISRAVIAYMRAEMAEELEAEKATLEKLGSDT